jgi:hypothetical protein
MKSARFPIVGVVASAGGLDAFKQLLSVVPANCEMAFVLVPPSGPKVRKPDGHVIVQSQFASGRRGNSGDGGRGKSRLRDPVQELFDH